MSQRTRNLMLLHLIVLIFGFTGILGKEISLKAEPLVFWRMLIAFVAIGCYALFKGRGKRHIPPKARWIMAVIALLITAHWITFFAAIKVSNVSVTLACIASTALFVSLLEPLFRWKKPVWYELVLGIAVIFGIGIIFQAESQYMLGILLAVLSAFLAASFSVLNAIMVEKHDSTAISLHEMGWGALLVFIYLLFTNQLDVGMVMLSQWDWFCLILLGVVATAFAFVVSVDVMKVLSPFTVSLSINLEPIYSILMALLLYPEEEKMSPYFYAGAGIILSTLFANAILKRHFRRKAEIKP